MISPTRIQFILEKAKELAASQKQPGLWESDALELVDPKEIAAQLGVRFSEPAEIYFTGPNGQRARIAGYIDRQKDEIAVAQRFMDERFSLEFRRFTAAHEIGHWVLHPGTMYFRDAPLDGGDHRDSQDRPIEEREADLFAAALLMPEDQVRDCFRQHFGEESLAEAPVDEHLAYILSFGTNQKVRVADLKKRRDISRLAAKCLSMRAAGIPPLASRFRVSGPAMAIRLEELNLIPGIPKAGNAEGVILLDTFISYARINEEFVKRIVSALKKRGINPWFDQLLVPGWSWWEGIEAAIKKSPSAVIFLGEMGLQGTQLVEVDILFNALVTKNSPVIPCLIPGWKGDLPYRLQTFHYVDFRKDEEEALDLLIQGILSGQKKL